MLPLKPFILCFIFSPFYFFTQAQVVDNNLSSYTQKIPGSTLTFKMVAIPKGKFLLGTSSADKKRNIDEGPQKEIQMDPFWMGAYEVTRDELDVFLKDETTSENVNIDAITRPSPQYVDLSWGMGKEGGYPANSMSQHAALMYCRWLYSKTKIFYRLPTEAEWEYACKAGTNTTYYFGNDVSVLYKYAWFQKNSSNKFQKVGQKLPNAWGLYDMLGNVLEWTLDHYVPNAYSINTSSNPIMEHNPSKYPKVLRGGSYSDNDTSIRVTKRFHSDPIWNRRDPQIPKSKWWLTEAKNVGFRIVRPVYQPSETEANDFFKKYLNL